MFFPILARVVRFSVIPCLLCLLLIGPAASQSLVATRTVISPITNFDLSYFDLTGSGGGPTLFSLFIQPSVPPDLTLYKIQVTITVQSNVVTGTLYDAETGAFTIPAGGLTITSNEMFAKNSMNDSLTIQNEFNVLDNEEIEKTILNSGRVPSGSIEFDFQLLQALANQSIASSSFSVKIANIRYVQLVAPGTKAVRLGDPLPEVLSTLPQFFWNSDLLSVPYSSGSVKFVVSVYENPDNRFDPATAVKQKPIWMEEVFDVNYAQYPVAGIPALIAGRVYYWKVKGVLIGPTQSEIESEVFGFKVANLALLQGLNPEQSEILRYLEMILGSNYGYILQELAGMKPAGDIRLDGKTIDLEALAALANAFRLNKWYVRRATLE